MNNLAALPILDDDSQPDADTLVSPAVRGWRLPEMTPADARRLAVALLEQAEEAEPAPIGHGVLPYGWSRITLVVPTLEDAPVVDLVLGLRAAGMGRSAVAQELNARGLTTQTGGDWHANAVRRLELAWAPNERKRFTVPTVNRFL